jgi:hypothetical protein
MAGSREKPYSFRVCSTIYMLPCYFARHCIQQAFCFVLYNFFPFLIPCQRLEPTSAPTTIYYGVRRGPPRRVRRQTPCCCVPPATEAGRRRRAGCCVQAVWRLFRLLHSCIPVWAMIAMAVASILGFHTGVFLQDALNRKNKKANLSGY